LYNLALKYINLFCIFFLQILCLAEQIRFTEGCEQAITRGDLQNYNKELETQLESYTNVDLSEVSGVEGHVLDLKLKALILDTIHAIDVVHQLLQAGCHSMTDWSWQKQLRY